MSESESTAGGTEFMCDFCGKQVERVRRIALDRDYDRLGIKHARQYACAQCSLDKEALRSSAAQRPSSQGS